MDSGWLKYIPKWAKAPVSWFFILGGGIVLVLAIIHFKPDKKDIPVVNIAIPNQSIDTNHKTNENTGDKIDNRNGNVINRSNGAKITTK